MSVQRADNLPANSWICIKSIHLLAKPTKHVTDQYHKNEGDNQGTNLPIYNLACLYDISVLMLILGQLTSHKKWCKIIKR